MTAKDIISWDTLKRLTTDLAGHLLGLDAEAIELLESQSQRVEDRRADLVALMRESCGGEFLLPRYYNDIRLAGQKGPIRQFLSWRSCPRIGI